MSGKKRARSGTDAPDEAVQPERKSQYVGVSNPVTPLMESSKWDEVTGEQLGDGGTRATEDHHVLARAVCPLCDTLVCEAKFVFYKFRLAN